MFKVLFLLFIVIPIIEIAVLMQVGAILGVWPTIAIVIFTAWLGANNVKQQGIATIQSLQHKMAQGEQPSDEVVAGLLLLVAGVLLVTPGFVTDIFGLSLLVPQFRTMLINSVRRHILVSQFGASQSFSFYSQRFDSQQSSSEHSSFEGQNSKNEDKPHIGQTIDGEFERKE